MGELLLNIIRPKKFTSTVSIKSKVKKFMKLYRFSPIRDKNGLMEAIKHIHFSCHQLCKQAMGEYLPVVGNIGVFCHYDDEYEFLTKIREELTDASDSFNQKYFRLHQPIVIPTKGDILEMTYTHLYIRQPDPYRSQVGDLDFYLEPEKYQELKQSLLNGKIIKGARIFGRTEDMIELTDPDIDICAYICTWKMIKKEKKERNKSVGM